MKVVSRTFAGDTISSDQLEGSRPDHLRRACSGRNLSCTESKELSYPVPLRKDAPHYQEKGGTLCLQDPYLSRAFDIFLFISDLIVFLKGRNGSYFLPHRMKQFSLRMISSFFERSSCITALIVVAVLHPHATGQCQRPPALQCHPFQAPQATSHSPGKCEHS